MNRKAYVLSPGDAQLIRDMAESFRAGDLGRPRPFFRRRLARSNFAFGIADATITGTTGAATKPHSGTVSLHTFTSTYGTSDSGLDVTAYNLSPVSATTGEFVCLARDFKSGQWVIVPTRKITVYECSNCTTGTTPAATVVVTFSGVTNTVCSAAQCAAGYAGSFVCAQQGTTGLAACYFEYAYVPGTATCADMLKRVTAFADDGFPGGNYRWRVVTEFGATGTCGERCTFTWDSGGTSPFDCSVARTLTFTSAQPDTFCCDMTSATATVTP